jgi:NAD(P)-dependent dehydrogenase (short-subunit alcohol dehydrogenase family)
MVLKLINATEAKVGTNIILDGVSCTVKSIDISKTGKHGSSKCRIEAVGIIDSKKKVLVVPADVTKEDEVKNLATSAVSKFGKIDIWINNAGVWLPLSPIEEVDMKRFHDMIEVNLFGTVYGSKMALIQMKKQGYGLILNVVSSSALAGRANLSAYTTSKFAEKGFTECLREEARLAGIEVVAVYPGGMKTALFDEKPPAEYEDYMDPEEVAQKIIGNLLSEKPQVDQIIKRPQKSNRATILPNRIS